MVFTTSSFGGIFPRDDAAEIAKAGAHALVVNRLGRRGLGKLRAGGGRVGDGDDLDVVLGKQPVEKAGVQRRRDKAEEDEGAQEAHVRCGWGGARVRGIRVAGGRTRRGGR
jgi:hypothetical protein